jgi:hypothetical protein
MTLGRGVQACIYSPRGATQALGSNRLEGRRRCNPRRRWRKLLEANCQVGPQGAGRPATVASQPMLHHGVFWNLLELSFTVFADRITCCHRVAYLGCMTVVLGLFSG